MGSGDRGPLAPPNLWALSLSRIAAGAEDAVGTIMSEPCQKRTKLRLLRGDRVMNLQGPAKFKALKTQEQKFMEVRTYTYRVLFQTEEGYSVFKFVTDFTKDEVIDRFAEFANTHKLRVLMDALALYPEPLMHTLALYRSAEEIAFNVMQDSRMLNINTQKPVYWEIDKQNRDYDADFLWDTSMVYARLNDTSDWIKVTDYPTERAVEQYKADQFEGFLKQCLHGKWFHKGSDYFQVLRGLLEYSNYPLEAAGFELTNELLLDELDAILQQEPVYVDYELAEYQDPWDDYGNDYVYKLRIIQLPEWLRNDAIDKFVDDLFSKIVK